MDEQDLARLRREREEKFKKIRHADEHFPIPWKEVSPEEFVARRWHNVGACSLHLYTYDDENLNAWMQRFSEVISSAESIDQARRSVLTAEEYRQLQEELEAFPSGGL